VSNYFEVSETVNIRVTVLWDEKIDHCHRGCAHANFTIKRTNRASDLVHVSCTIRHVITDIGHDKNMKHKRRMLTQQLRVHARLLQQHFSPPLLLMWQRRREARKLSARGQL
jgi:hypothetical protein